MQSEWQETTLADVSVDVSYGYTESASAQKVGPRFLRITDIQNGVVNWNTVPYCPISLKDHKKYKLHHGDIVVARTGNSTGENYLFSSQEDAVYASYLIRFKIDKARANPKFVWYTMRSKFWWDFVHASKTGSAQAGANAKVLGGYALNLPPLNEQKAIAHILGSLDDKIELNRQMNATLEAMAQALFKSWFVDFDPVLDNALAAGNPIPDELQDKAAAREALGDARKPLPEDIAVRFPAAFVWTEEMGWIPEGWEIKSLDELITLIGGGTPKTSVAEYWDGDIPWFSVVDAPNPSDVFVTDTEKHVTQAGLDNSSAKILPVGTTIISARGTVGKCAMVATPMAMNQSCYGVRGKDSISDTYVYYAIYLQVADLQQRSHGSVFSTITRDTFKTIKLPFGSPQITVKLDDAIRPYFDKILSNSLQANTLKQLRDTLLPKLLSGELRIPDAEKLVEEIQS